MSLFQGLAQSLFDGFHLLLDMEYLSYDHRYYIMELGRVMKNG